MAIKSNSSTEEVVGSGMKLYSGLTNVNVIAVNPTMAELHALNINVKQEPNYSVYHLDNIDYEKLFERALKKKISMFYEALDWSFPVEKEYTLERFF